jgi:hypothetical protein
LPQPTRAAAANADSAAAFIKEGLAFIGQSFGKTKLKNKAN